MKSAVNSFLRGSWLNNPTDSITQWLRSHHTVLSWVPWFSFRYNPSAIKRVANDMVFAPITMKSRRCIPYNIHNVAPALNWMSVNPLTSLTEWVVHILTICGTNPNMVNEAAPMPNIVHHIFPSFYSSLISQPYALSAMRAFGIPQLFLGRHRASTRSYFLNNLTMSPWPWISIGSSLRAIRSFSIIKKWYVSPF
jgi:hypothetical protein